MDKGPPGRGIGLANWGHSTLLGLYTKVPGKSAWGAPGICCVCVQGTFMYWTVHKSAWRCDATHALQDLKLQALLCTVSFFSPGTFLYSWFFSKHFYVQGGTVHKSAWRKKRRPYMKVPGVSGFAARVLHLFSSGTFMYGPAQDGGLPCT